MEKKALKEKLLATPQVKRILESIGEEKLDQFQRRTLDYAAKFSKVSPDAAETPAKKLVEEFGLEEDEAIQIINCMPESVEELRTFLSGGRKIVEISKLEEILALLNSHRKEK